MARVIGTRASLGQAVPLLMVVVALAGAVSLGLAHMGVEIHDRQQAQVAADAAALAGVDGGAVSAGNVAMRNGARLVSCAAHGDDVVVVVVFRGHRAVARATRAP
jgi:orotidine-5'-phosphate decarboxylase